jgi:hypothetical protein
MTRTASRVMQLPRQILLVCACSVFLHGAPAFAQSTTPDATKVESPAATPEKATTGTAPKDMGSTGWTGPHKGEQTGTEDGAANQPLTATGTDLKGPPRRFPPSRTPE